VREEQQRKRSAERYDKSVERQAKIGTIDRKLAALGGRNGGWDVRDQDVFLRAWTQSITSEIEKQLAGSDTPDIDLSLSSRALVMKRCQPLLPAMGEEEISEHISWYCITLHLHAQKKELLERWRNEREKESQKLLEEEERDEDKDGDGSRSVSSSSISVSHINSRKCTQDPVEVKQQVAMWRRQQDEEKQQKEIEKKMIEERQKQKREDELRKRQQSSRMRLQQWKHERVQEESSTESSKDTQKPRARSVDPALLRRRASQDREIAEKKRRLREERERVEQGRELKFREQLQKQQERTAQKPRDPSHVLAPTTASRANQLSPEELDEREHRRANGGAHSASVAYGGYDLHQGGRAVPSWCRGIR